MKKSFFFLFSALLCVVTCVSFAQENGILKKDTDGNYSYEKVYEVPGKSKSEIFNLLKSWVVKNVKTQANSNFDEATQGNISCNPAFACSYGSVTDFKLNFDIKDGKYRLTANAFVWHNTTDGNNKNLGDFSGMGMFPWAQKKIIRDAQQGFAGIVKSIEEASMKQASDNW